MPLLTDTKIRQTKPNGKSFKLSDTKGMYLLITPQGTKLWKFKYRFLGREKKLSFGAYPEVSLADARIRRDEARQLLAKDIDPGIAKKVNQRAQLALAKNTLENVAREWYAKFSVKWTKEHGDRILRRLEKDVFPWIGSRPITQIEAPEILQMLQRVESRGAIETAHRIQQNCSQIFRYAVASGKSDRNPCVDLKGALQPVKARHHASIIEPNAIANLMRTIDGYQGHYPTKCALQLSALFFVRPGELRRAEWTEFDFENAQWHIPAEKMKMREKHIVPLSAQALEILTELQALTGTGKYVFPSIRSPMRPMSENTVNGALRRLGYTSDEMTAHGFRRM